MNKKEVKTWKELAREIAAIKKMMRVNVCGTSFKNADTGSLTMIVSTRGIWIMNSDSKELRIADEDGDVPPILNDIVRNALESELARLRAQAGEELKTLALIAAGATP